jgi:hypothetical protein
MLLYTKKYQTGGYIAPADNTNQIPIGIRNQQEAANRTANYEAKLRGVLNSFISSPTVVQHWKQNYEGMRSPASGSPEAMLRYVYNRGEALTTIEDAEAAIMAANKDIHWGKK